MSELYHDIIEVHSHRSVETVSRCFFLCCIHVFVHSFMNAHPLERFGLFVFFPSHIQDNNHENIKNPFGIDLNVFVCFTLTVTITTNIWLLLIHKMRMWTLDELLPLNTIPMIMLCDYYLVLFLRCIGFGNGASAQNRYEISSRFAYNNLLIQSKMAYCSALKSVRHPETLVSPRLVFHIQCGWLTYDYDIGFPLGPELENSICAALITICNKKYAYKYVFMWETKLYVLFIVRFFLFHSHQL